MAIKYFLPRLSAIQGVIIGINELFESLSCDCSLEEINNIESEAIKQIQKIVN